MLIEFEIDNQKLTRITDEFLADKSNNIIQCRFNFKGSDWEDKQRFVILYDHNCNAYQLHLDENNTIPIPYHILVKEKFSITCYGEDLEENRITTNMVTLRLDLSGYTTDLEDLVDVDPDVWTQIWEAIDGKSGVGHTHTKADVSDFHNISLAGISGEYNDLIGKPSIPVKISDLINDGCFIETSDIVGLVRNDGSIDTTLYLTEHQDISGKINYTDIVDNLTTNDNTKVLSAKQGKVLAGMIGDVQTYVNK